MSIYDIFDEFGIDNCKIELLEVFPCTSKEELEQREGHWVRHEICVTEHIPNRSRSEYYQDNKIKIAEQSKKYREDNLEHCKCVAAKYYQENKDKIDLRHKE